jgi:hypothetical protein
MYSRFNLLSLSLVLFPYSSSQAAPVARSTSTVAVSTFTWRSAPNNAFAPDEEFNFSISWGVVSAGNSSLSVKNLETVAGRPTYHIVAQAKSTGMVDTFYRVRDQNDSLLDQASLTSVRFERHMHEGKYQIEETITIDQPRREFAADSYRVDKKRYEVKQGTVPANVLDVLGSFYYIRTLPLEVGKEYTLDVLSSEKNWPLVVKVLKREKVKVPAGKFSCLLIQPVLRHPGIFVAKGKKLEVWVTDDARHMPVRMRSEVFIGHVSADLVSYKTP